MRYKIRPLTSSFALLFVLLAAASPRAAESAPKEPTEASSSCGNGLLDGSENCEYCPADCRPADCKPGKETAAFDVALSAPPARKPGAVGVRLAYRTSALSLPGTGADKDVRARVTSTPEGAFVAAHDLGYAARVVVAKSGGFERGRLFRIEFDLCEGVKEVTAADVACVVESCGSADGQVEDCGCDVTKSVAGR